MKIGIVCYPTYGGSGVVATELGKFLARKGHQVHFICYHLPVRLESWPDQGITFHSVEVVSYPLFKFPPYTLALAAKIIEVIQKYGLEIIHVHYTVPHTMAAYLALKALKDYPAKIITTLHGTDISLIGMDPSYKSITRFGLETSHGVTAVSHYLAEITRQEFEFSNPIKVIHNFVDARKFAKTSIPIIRKKFAPCDEKIITHISNFRMIKRIPDVLEVFQLIQRRVPAILLMVGDGPETPTSMKLAREMGLTAKVHFLKFVNSVQKILNMSDLFLLPSETESFGLAALEAMSCQVPVVAYRVGGLPEVVEDGRSGFLVAKGDIEAMARFALLILEDKELSQRMGERGRYLAVNRFSEEEKVTEYEQYYQKIWTE
ncbi:MAG: N-acetyl-alpha-D-glucosaminyl L-malate synthase BshA [bacterium]